MVFQYAVNILGNYKHEQLQSLLEIVTMERKMKIDKFLNKSDKMRSLLAEVLLRYGLWKHFSIKDNEIKFIKNEFGKPHLLNYPHIHFNLSHSGDWVLCGVGDIPLGVDVEIVTDRNLELGERFYTSNEYNFILQQPLEKQAYSFFELWTLKESYVKAVGKGLSIPFNSFRFEKLENMMQLYINEIRENSYAFRNGELDEKHCMSICVKNDNEGEINKEITVVTVLQLVEWKSQIR